MLYSVSYHGTYDMGVCWPCNCGRETYLRSLRCCDALALLGFELAVDSRCSESRERVVSLVWLIVAQVQPLVPDCILKLYYISALPSNHVDHLTPRCAEDLC